MHTFKISATKPGTRSGRFFCNLNLPDNPLCWLLGHKAAVTVVEPRYIDAYRRVECRICGRRYQPPQSGVTGVDSTPEERKELARRQVEFARQDPKQVEESCSGREHYAGRQMSLSAELYLRKPTRARFSNVSLRLHTGTRGSETPYDAHIDLGVVAGYFGVGGVGSRWASWLGRGHGRDLSVSLHGGSLWWKGWYDGNSGNDEHHRCDKWRDMPWTKRRKYHSWACLRDGSIALNPLDALWGNRLYHYENQGDARRALVTIGQFDGDEYPVDITLRRQEQYRDHGPRWARRVASATWTAEWKADECGGIPFRNHDWKGDTALASSVSLDGWSEADGDWLPVAVERLRASILRDRERYEYRPRTATA